MTATGPELTEELSNLAFVQGNVGDTRANITKALKVEEYVSERMFPVLADLAAQRGREDVAKFFQNMARGEAIHAIQSAVRETRNDRLLRRPQPVPIWARSIPFFSYGGWIEEGARRPLRWPLF